MEGWNGGLWSYRSHHREETVGSNVSSSRSGTIVSTTYTSSASRPSSNSVEPAMHFYSLGIHEEEEHGNNVDSKTLGREEAAEELMDLDSSRSITKIKGKKRRDRNHIRSLVQEFSIALSANCSSKAGDMCVVERWLTELGVGWVLSLDDVVSSSGVEELDHDAWTRALDHIAQTLSSMRPQFPDRGSVGLPSICQRGVEHVGQTCIPNRYHLVLFIQRSMLKMFTFIDVIVAWDPYASEGFLLDQKDFFWFSSMPSSHNKLIALLGVHDALSEASDMILTEFDDWPASVEVQRIENEMASLLLAYKSKACEAIRSTMEKIRTNLMEDGDDSSSQQGSPDIHKVTWPIMMYTSVLLSNCSSVDAAICDQYVPHIKNVRPVHSMIIEMVSRLQEKLAKISEPFPDQGLRSLFLLNNTYYIQEFKSFYYLQLPVDLSEQIEGYMKRYLQVSWAPLVSCLFNSTSLRLGKNYNPLSKFESEFQKTYTTQKQWKVPDPDLRRRLREVITDKIIPGYTEYIKDNKVTNPKFSPQELKEMLQELFEG